MGTTIKYNNATISSFEPNTGTKVLECNGNVMATDVEIETNIDIYDGSLVLPRVGGRIFYVDTTSTGGTYTFYKQDGSQITTSNPPTVAELADAYYYSVTGTPDKDMFYVYDSENGLATSKYWGWYNTQIGSSGVPPYRTDGLGYGRLNTNAVFTKGIPTDYTPNVWEYIRDINSANTGGCSDWFVGSEAEQDKLRASGLVNWYSSNNIWSSVENFSVSAYTWFYNISLWDNGFKNSYYCVVALRAF